MNRQKNDFNNYVTPAPFLVAAIIFLLAVFTPLGELIVGLVGGAIGLVVGLAAGIFGLVIGLIGGAIGIVFGIVGAVFGVVFGLLPLILIAWVIVMIVRNGQGRRTVDLDKPKNDFV